MKLNPKIAQKPEDLKALEYKSMKVLIKKELLRLEKYTSSEMPTQCILQGNFAYTDKPDMALILFGTWKGKFKEFAKKELVKEDSGVIGTAYFGGVDDLGQKIIHINIAKGRGKTKITLFNKNLRKLFPLGYNILFSYVDGGVLDAFEQKLEAAPEQEAAEIDKMPAVKIAMGDVIILSAPKIGKYENGKELLFPRDTELLVKSIDDEKIVCVSYLERFVPVTVEITRKDIRFPLEVASLNAISWLYKLIEEEDTVLWADSYSAKIGYKLKTFRYIEEEAFWEDASLQEFVISKLSAKQLLSGMASWRKPLVEKLTFLNENGKKLQYSELREMILCSDLSDFDIEKHLSLFNIANVQELTLLVEDLELNSTDRKFLEEELNVELKAIKSEKLFYDDLNWNDKKRIFEFSKADLDRILLAEEKKEQLTETDAIAIIEWFQRNALKEASALLDFSEQQVNRILYDNAAAQYNALKKDFLQLLASPYADGIYTYEQALSKSGAEISSIELRQSILKALGHKHPILYTITNYKALKKVLSVKNPKKRQHYLEDVLVEVLSNIDKTREKLRQNADRIWEMKTVYENTFHNLRLSPTSEAGKIIVKNKEKYERDEAFYSLSLAALSVGFGLLSAVAERVWGEMTATTVLANEYEFEIELIEDDQMYVETNASLQQAQTLTNEKPTMLWVALVGLGVFMDILALRKLLENITISDLDEMSDVEHYSDEVAKIIAKEKGINDVDSEDFKFILSLSTHQAKAAITRKDAEGNRQKSYLAQQVRNANRELYMELKKSLAKLI